METKPSRSVRSGSRSRFHRLPAPAVAAGVSTVPCGVGAGQPGESHLRAILLAHHQVGVRDDIVRPQEEGPVKVVGRLLGPTRYKRGDSETAVCPGMIGIELERPAIGLERLVETILAIQSDAEVEVSFGQVRLEVDRSPENRPSPLRPGPNRATGRPG